MINSMAVAAYRIVLPAKFLFFTDVDKKIVAMKVCDNGIYKGYSPKNTCVIRVSNITVLRSLCFDLTATIKRPLHRDEETGYLYFYLNEPEEGNG